jgi:hypothetical protein
MSCCYLALSSSRLATLIWRMGGCKWKDPNLKFVPEIKREDQTRAQRQGDFRYDLIKNAELLVPFSLCAFSALETQVRVLILNIMYINYSDFYMDSYDGS